MAEVYGHEAPEDVNKDLLCTCLKRVAVASEFFLYLLNLFHWLSWITACSPYWIVS